MRKLINATKFIAACVVSLFIINTASAENMSTLYRTAGNTLAGNPDGHVTIVEFFDYNCGYCRIIYPSVNKILASNHDLRLVFREYPVLSERSILPAQAALAAQMQGKYMPLHTAMMEASLPLVQGEINKLAAEVGIDTNKLEKDMRSSEVASQLKTNLNIGQALNIQGVPSFIVARTSPPSTKKAQVLVGPSIEDLQAAIAQAEKSK